MADFIHERQANIANRFSIVRDAVNRLDDRHDKSWDINGQPSLEAVAAMTGFEVTREELNKFGRVRRELAAVADKTAHADPTPDEAAAAFNAADVALAESRERLRVASLNVRTTRTALATATGAWMAQFKVSAEANARAFIATSIEDRRKLASGEIAPAERPRPAASRIDEMNSGQRQRGYGSSYRRGAYGASAYGTTLPREKLPSAR